MKQFPQFLDIIIIVYLEHCIMGSTSAESTFEYEDCMQGGASYHYDNKIICYWIDTLSIEFGHHCGNYNYSWIPDSSANNVLYKLAQQHGYPDTQQFHIGYTISYAHTSYPVGSSFQLFSSDGEERFFHNFNDTVDPSNTCVEFEAEVWNDIPCTKPLKAFCSWVIDFNYHDCLPNAVSYTTNQITYCYWVEKLETTPYNACGGRHYSVIPDINAQRVVHWLIKWSNTPYLWFNIGYTENADKTVTRFGGGMQTWTNWDITEPNEPNDVCINLMVPYGTWFDGLCDFPTYSVCSIIVVCGLPRVYANSSLINQTGDQPDDVANYTCNYGYSLESGNLTRTCQVNASWDGIPPVCSPIPCPDLPVPNATYTATGMLPGDVITYFCAYGYEIISGNVSRTCQLGGVWDEILPTCSVIKCTAVTVQNTEYVMGNGDPGDKIIYTCSTGYELASGNLTRYCQLGGNWDGTLPTCSVIKCSAFTVENADYVMGYGVPGDKIIYTCSTGYELSSGNLTRYCQLGDDWDGTLPTCSAISDITSPATTSATTSSATTSGNISPATTSGTTSSASPTSDLCRCNCHSSNTTIDIQERIEELEKILKVNKDVLSSTVRKLTSAEDSRPSSAYIGYTGAVIICVVVGIFIAFDFSTIFIQLKSK